MDTSNWKRINITKIFDISYGNKLDMCQMTPCNDGISFVTRTATNNGVGGIVEPVNGICAYPAGSLSIALGGSIGSTFLQTRDFYTSQNVAVLQPKEKLSSEILLFLATLIEKECSMRFVAFGRELNKHIKRDFTIKLPLLEDDKPNWKELETLVKDRIIPQLPKKAQKVWLQKYDTKPQHEIDLKFDVSAWHWYTIGDLFTSFERGKVHSQNDLPSGNEYLYIGAKKKANGVMCRCGYDKKLISKGNCIIFICNGEGSVGYCNYMDRDFMASGDLVMAYADFLNPYIGMFFVSLLDLERPKYSFGRKYGPHVKSTKILLPTKDNCIDWQFMEDYIKSLPYSKNLEPSNPNEKVDELMEVKKELIKLQQVVREQKSPQYNVHIDTYNDNSTNYNVEK